MGLKIIGSGFGRTGTMSLKGALEQLAFGPCHHFDELLAHPEQVYDWQGIVAGRRMNWEEVFAGYRSQVDWPGAHRLAGPRCRLSASQGDPHRPAGRGLVEEFLADHRRPANVRSTDAATTAAHPGADASGNGDDSRPDVW